MARPIIDPFRRDAGGLGRHQMESTARLRWHLKRASCLARWVPTLVVVDEYPMFSKVPRADDWSDKLVWDMRIADWLRMYNMVHVQL